LITDPSHGAFQVQLAPITFHLAVAEVDQHVAKRLVSHLPQWHAHEFFHRQCFRLAWPVFEQQAADLRQVVLGAGMGIVARNPRPQGILVELDPFRAGFSKHHGAQPPVSHRQGFGPFFRRLLVPQHQRPRVGGDRPAGKENRQANRPGLNPSHRKCLPRR